MLPWLTLGVLTAAAVALVGVPRSMLLAYRTSFVARHGVSVQLGLAVLATVTLAMLLATLVLHERKPLMELVDAAVVALTLVAGAADLYFFSRGRGP
jgi:hypothetical protein